MAPPHTFLDAVLDAEEAAELADLEASLALFDTDFEIEDEPEL
jgi:hypothetical protein